MVRIFLFGTQEFFISSVNYSRKEKLMGGSTMFCNQCGHPLDSGSSFCSQCGARIPGNTGKEDVLQAVAAALVPYPQLVLTWGQNTDLEITNVLADADWQVGRKKIEYSARLLVRPEERNVIFWEMIKETGMGMGALFSFKKETYRSDGHTRSGTVSEIGYGMNGKVIDYDWDYGQVRNLVENAVRGRGWQFKTALLKGKASY